MIFLDSFDHVFAQQNTFAHGRQNLQNRQIYL